jgi:hypothetical protein
LFRCVDDEKLHGKKVGVIDLTRGELGTRTPELRAQAAKAAHPRLDIGKIWDDRWIF